MKQEDIIEIMSSISCDFFNTSNLLMGEDMPSLNENYHNELDNKMVYLGVKGSNQVFKEDEEYFVESFDLNDKVDELF